MHKKLFIPGPVEVRNEILQEMAKPLISHRAKDIAQLQKEISSKLQILMYTKNDILLSTSSSSGLMEAGVRSCTAKKVAIFSIGAFGDRWYKIAQSNNIASDIYSSEWGDCTSPEMVDKALATGNYDTITITHNETSTGITNNLEAIGAVVKKYPDVVLLVDAVSSLGGCKIECDKLGIDILISGTQKCLGLPPGLALCSVSQKALQRATKVPFRGSYLDLIELHQFVTEKNYQYPSTPNISLMFALNSQLDYILREGLDARFKRHSILARHVHHWLEERGLELYGKKEYASNTVSCIKNGLPISVSELNQKLIEQGFVISNGYGRLKNDTFRIAHMADLQLNDLQELLNTIDGIVS